MTTVNFTPLFFLTLALKGTLLLVGAALAARLLHRHAASLRHGVWAVAMLGLVLLPLAAVLLPSVTVPVGFAPADAPALATWDASPRLADVPAPDKTPALESNLADPLPADTDLAAPRPEPSALAETPEPLWADAEAANTMPAAVADRAVAWNVTWAEALGLLWLIGVVFGVTRLLWGLGHAFHFVRGGRPVTDGTWRAQTARLARRLGTSVPELRWSATAATPMVWGVNRAVIVLPESAADWSEERREVVLLHELAHVRRRDCAVQVLVQLACALHWFNPLTWWAAKRLIAERERACDDAVLRAGTRASGYAEHLLAIARAARVNAPASAIAMARPSELEGRLLAILDATRRREDLGRRTAWAALATTAALVGVLAIVQPGHAERPAEAAWPNTALAEDLPADSSVPAAKPEKAKASAPTTTPTKPVPPSAVHQMATDDPLQQRWDAALATARRADANGFWIGYGIRRMMPANQHFIVTHDMSIFTSGDWQYHQDQEHPRLWQVIGRPMPPAPREDDALVEMDVALMFKFGPDGRAVKQVWMGNTSFPADLEGLPLRWLGMASDAESIPLLKAQYAASNVSDVREVLTEAVGAHGTSALVVPFLTDVLGSRAVDDVREEAVWWLRKHADHPGVIATLRRTAEADRSHNVRKEAIESLGRIPSDAAVDVLLTLARSLDKADLRKETAESLGRQTTSSKALAALDVMARGDASVDVQREAVEAMRKHSGAAAKLRAIAESHPNPTVRKEAVEQIGRLDDPNAVATLQSFLRRSGDAEVQREAVESLGRLKGQGQDVLFDLARSHPSPVVRKEALEQLRKQPSPEAVRVLRDVANADADFEVRREAVESLARLDDGLDVLAQMSRTNDDPRIRKEIADELRRYDDRAGDVLRRMAESDADAVVRGEAVESLARLTSGSRHLAELADHNDARVRREVADELRRYDDPAAAAALKRIAFEDAEPAVQHEAVEALGRMDRGVPVLFEVLKRHPDASTRREAAETLRRFDRRDVAAALADAARSDADVSVQREAIESLARLAGGADALATLARSHPSPAVRIEIADELRKFDTPETAATLGAMALNDEHLGVQREAVESLARMKSSHRVLMDLVDHPSQAVRVELAEELRKTDAAFAASTLMRMAEREKDARVRAEALESLVRLNTEASLKAVASLAKSSDRDLRRAALEALLDSKDPRAQRIVDDLIGNR